MIKPETSINVGIFTVLSAIPLVAEYVTAKPVNVPGTGFDVLCYEPFDYAYFLLALFLFVFANILIARKQKKPMKKALITGGSIAVAWFLTERRAP